MRLDILKLKGNKKGSVLMLEGKEAKLKSAALLFFVLIISVLYVYAIAQNDVTVNSPANGTWSNQSNFTAGFNFSWSDSNGIVELATATLYMQNDSDTGLTTDKNNSFGINYSVKNNSNTVIYMNQTFPGENVPRLIYWTIKAENGTSWFPDARVIRLDNTTFPNATNHSMNFKNNTWINYMPRIEVIANDYGPLRGDTLTLEFYNSSKVIASATAGNNSPINLTNESLSDGIYSGLKIKARDPAGNINNSELIWNVSIDTTNATVTFNEPTPINKNNQTSGSITFNFTIVEINAEQVFLELDKVNRTINIINSTLSITSNIQINATNITGSNLTNGTYYYLIAALDGTPTGETHNSTLANISIKLNITGNQIIGNATNISWNAVPGAVSYRVYNSSKKGNFTFDSYANVTGTRFIHAGQAMGDDHGTVADITSAYVFSDCNITATPITAPFLCNVTNSSMGDNREYNFTVWVNDSAGNLVNSSFRQFSVDTKAPRLNPDQIYNWTIIASTANFTFQINDTAPAQCRAKIEDADNNTVSLINGTISGIGRDDSGSYSNCTGLFNFSDINSVEGQFNVKFNVTDGVNNSNQTTKYGVLTRIYSGWNLITYPDGNKSAIEICNQIQNCTQVAWFNNTAASKSFVTFSRTTPSVNNRTNIKAGEGVHVFASVPSWVITNDNLPVFTEETAWNFSLEVNTGKL